MKILESESELDSSVHRNYQLLKKSDSSVEPVLKTLLRKVNEINMNDINETATSVASIHHARIPSSTSSNVTMKSLHKDKPDPTPLLFTSSRKRAPSGIPFATDKSAARLSKYNISAPVNELESESSRFSTNDGTITPAELIEGIDACDDF